MKRVTALLNFLFFINIAFAARTLGKGLNSRSIGIWRRLPVKEGYPLK